MQSSHSDHTKLKVHTIFMHISLTTLNMVLCLTILNVVFVSRLILTISCLYSKIVACKKYIQLELMPYNLKDIFLFIHYLQFSIQLLLPVGAILYHECCLSFFNLRFIMSCFHLFSVPLYKLECCLLGELHKNDALNWHTNN